MLPPLHAGWAVRRKSNHFSAYDDVVKKFAKLIDVDPWMINPVLRASAARSISRSAPARSALAARRRRAGEDPRRSIAEYGISERPFVIVKADAGTYGMGIMTVHDAVEVRRR